jgi:hypothetical protein
MLSAASRPMAVVSCCGGSLVRHQVDQLVLADEVAVEVHRPGLQRGGYPADRHGIESVGVGQAGRGRDDRLPGRALAVFRALLLFLRGPGPDQPGWRRSPGGA